MNEKYIQAAILGSLIGGAIVLDDFIKPDSVITEFKSIDDLKDLDDLKDIDLKDHRCYNQRKLNVLFCDLHQHPIILQILQI